MISHGKAQIDRGRSIKNPPVQAGGVATSYFPMGLPQQYHRSWKA